MKKYFVGLTFITLLGLSFFALPTFAANPEAVGGQSTNRAYPSLRPSPSSATNGKIQACQARQTAILNRTGSLYRMATDMLAKFDSISIRVQAYYNKSGKKIANYDALVAASASKRTAVTTALDSAQKEVIAFNCSDLQSKKHMFTYLTYMKSVKQALKEYRTSIRNLIVAVRTAASVERPSNRPSSTPKSVPANPSRVNQKGNL